MLRLLGAGAAGRGSPWYAGGNHPRHLFQPDQEAGYTLRPGFRGREVAASGEFITPVVVDERGLREHPWPADTGRPRVLARRILALGDSMTFGEGVEASAAFPALLEAATGCRVDNGGVPGYSTVQMAVRLERLLPRLQPDLVLVTFSPTWDRGRCAAPFVYLEGFIVGRGYRDRLHLVGGNLYAEEVHWPVIGPLTAHAKGRSHLFRLLLPPLGDLARGLGPDPAAPAWDAGYDTCLDRLESARGRAEAAGARFLAVLADSPGPTERAHGRYVERALARRGIPHLPLDRVLPRRGAEARRYPLDRHWNARGHREVAAALAPEVAARTGCRPGSGQGPGAPPAAAPGGPPRRR